jgi:hypothetical protein
MSGLNRNPQNIYIYSSRLLEKAGSAFSLEEPRPVVGVLQILRRP